MTTKTIKGNSPESIAAELKRCTGDDFTPTLAFVFLSIKQNRDAVCRLLDEQCVAIFGATTAGEFIDGEVEEGSIVMMLLNLDPSFFKIHFAEIGEGDLRQIAQAIGATGKNSFDNPAFLISYSGLFNDGELIVRGIVDIVGENATIFGGMAGDELTMQGPGVFTNKQHSNNGVIAVIIDGNRVTLKGHATSGWRPVGTVRTITKSEGSVVYTIDDEPALDVVMKYLGATYETPNEMNDAVVKMGSYFPILLLREGADPVVRTSMFANVAERCLKFSGNVPQGSKIRFSLPPDFEVIDQVITKSDELRKNQLPQADALILFSCIARHVTLGPMVSEEIEGVKKVWNSPLIGFFSYGEIGKSANGKHEFHNNTCCLVAMKEQ
ncbi:MAG: FIST C-terminal domain-containing protein [Flavisolibacter sp.]|nr:FIST C-terminal domain-containing protein [Flavisolibacter sp.]